MLKLVDPSTLRYHALQQPGEPKLQELLLAAAYTIEFLAKGEENEPVQSKRCNESQDSDD